MGLHCHTAVIPTSFLQRFVLSYVCCHRLLKEYFQYSTNCVPNTVYKQHSSDMHRINKIHSQRFLTQTITFFICDINIHVYFYTHSWCVEFVLLPIMWFHNSSHSVNFCENLSVTYFMLYLGSDCSRTKTK